MTAPVCPGCGDNGAPTPKGVLACENLECRVLSFLPSRIEGGPKA